MKGVSIRWRRAAAAAAAVVFLTVGAWVTGRIGLGGNDKDSEPVGNSEAYSKDADSAYSSVNFAPAISRSESAESGSQDLKTDEKIIRTAYLTIKTQIFENDLSAIKTLAAGSGGRVESLSVGGDAANGVLRYASLTLRIPSAALDSFLSGAKGVGRVTDYEETAQDISKSYYDIQTRLDAQEAKWDRLLSLMGTAATLSELIELENALGDTQYWIDSYKAQLKGYDSSVLDSTVYVTLWEESAAEAAVNEMELGSRIRNALVASLKAARSFLYNIAVFLAAALPWIAGTALICVIIRVMIRKSKKHGNRIDSDKTNVN